jgi:hypothetical protein
MRIFEKPIVKGVIRLKEKKEGKMKFVEPELVKHKEKLDEVTMMPVVGSPNGNEISPD